jgi:hypothetical protein
MMLWRIMGKSHMVDPDTDGRIVSKGIIEKCA